MMLSVTAALAQVPPPPGPDGPGPQPPVEFVPQAPNPSAAPEGGNAPGQPLNLATPESPATQPGATTQSATTAPAAPVATDIYIKAQEESPNNSRVAFNFKDATVDTILDYLSDTLGFIVIKDSRINVRVTVTSRRPVDASEAVDLLNSVLDPMNYSVLQRGRVLRVLPRDKAKKSNVPVRFGSDPAKIRMTDEIITQVIPVNNVDAVKLRTDLSSMLSSDADVTSNAGSNTIIITDTSARIRRVVEVINALDSHRTAVNDIKTFQLKFANATTTAKLINDIFKQDASSSNSNSGNPFQQMFRNRGFPGMPGQQQNQDSNSNNGNAIAGKVNAAADDRTNIIVVTGPTDTLKLIERVVAEIDANPAADQEFFMYRVKNGTASNMEYTLNTLFGNPTSSSSSNSSRTTSSSSSSGSSRTSGSSNSITSTGSNSNRNAANTSRVSNMGGMNTNLSSTAQTAASLLKGQVYVVADADTNSLLISTNSKYMNQVRQILTELDRSVKQVLIKVLVAEVTHNSTDDMGINYGELSVTENLGYVAPGGAAAGGIVNGAATPRPIYGTVSSSMTATMRALASAGKLDVLSRPYVLTSDNQPATMRVGQDIPYTTATQITDSGQVINSNDYRSVGISLDVTPHINPDGLVVLDIIQEVSQKDDNSSVVLSGNVTSPIFDIRRADSRVAIRNGQTIVIGGLMQDKLTDQVDKVPLLGDIPGLSYLFKRTTKTKTKSELLVFLTPHVVTDAAALTDVSKQEMTGVKIVPNAVEPGAFDEHMKGLNLGATAPSEPIYTPATQPAPKKK